MSPQLAENRLSELVQQRKAKFEEIQELTKKPIEEKRLRTKEESERFTILQNDFESIDGQIVELESEMDMQKRVNSDLFIPRRQQEEDQAPAYSLGEMLVDVANQKRLQRTSKHFEGIKKRTLSSHVPSEGGWLIQQDNATDLIQSAMDQTNIAQLCDKVTLGPNSNGLRLLKLKGNSRKTGSRYGGIRVYWIGEAEAPSYSNPQFERDDTDCNKLGALIRVSEELLQDAIALESWIRSEFPKEFAFIIDEAIITGSGQGAPLGILNSSVTQVALKEAGQAAQTFTYDNFIEMEDLYYGSSAPSMFINRKVKKQLRKMAHLIGVGGVPVFQPGTALAGMNLGGYSLSLSEHCEAIGTKGDVILGDFSQYRIVEKAGLRADESMHVFFETDEMCFRFVKRIGGRPKDTEAVTPFKGVTDEKYSPFVVLEDRA